MANTAYERMDSKELCSIPSADAGPNGMEEPDSQCHHAAPPRPGNTGLRDQGTRYKAIHRYLSYSIYMRALYTWSYMCWW